MHSGAPFKCVVVGDAAVGKTCLLIAYTTNAFPTGYIPLVTDNFTTTTTNTAGHSVDVVVWDALAGESHEHERIRTLSYPDTDVFLILFSVVRPPTFESVVSKWLPGIQQVCPNASYILVGTKTDLRDGSIQCEYVESNGPPITFEQGVTKAKEIKAFKYVECSALTQKGVKEVFDTIHSVVAALPPKPPKEGYSQTSFRSPIGGTVNAGWATNTKYNARRLGFDLNGVQKMLDAAANGDVKQLNAVLSDPSVDALVVNKQDDGYGFTALHYAAASGHIQCVKALLAKGADPNIQDVCTSFQILEN
ncbi:rac protein [Pelomyxa schiedti]|nr:rac protein [Pelomyxa schiedti]